MKLWHDSRVVVAIYVATAILVSMIYYSAPANKTYVRNGLKYTHYNNYVIFKNAARHLETGENLYQKWPDEQWDQFKYSPTFAAAMWPMAQLHDLLGLCLWNVMGSLSLLYALRALSLSSQATAIAAWLIFKDHLTSVQNAQSNCLVAAAMILTFVYWERGQLLAAALAIALSLYTKLFGVAVAMLWLVFPNKTKSLAWCLLAVGILGAVPLAITSPENLWQQYHNWFATLRNEFPDSQGISVMAMLQTWFGISGHKTETMFIGGLFLIAPLLRVSLYRNRLFQLSLLAATLIWVVLFNHRAEPATFIIASTGVAVWFVSRPMTLVNIALAVLTVILSQYSASDLVPQWLQQHVIDPYHLKALPALLVWLKLQVELWSIPSPQPLPVLIENKNTSQVVQLQVS